MIGCGHPFTAILSASNFHSGTQSIRVICVCCGSGKDFQAAGHDDAVCTNIAPGSVWAATMSRVLELNETAGSC